MSTTCIYFICAEDEKLLRFKLVFEVLESNNAAPAIDLARKLGDAWDSEFAEIDVYDVTSNKHIDGEVYLEFSISANGNSDIFDFAAVLFNKLIGKPYDCVVGYSSTGVEYSLSVNEGVVNWKEREYVNPDGFKVLVSGHIDVEPPRTVEKLLEEIGCIPLDDAKEVDALIVGKNYDRNLQALFREANKPILNSANFWELIEGCYRL